MKKYSYLTVMMIICLGLIGCTNYSQEKKAEPKQDSEQLSLHMLTIHQDTELDEYLTELYEGIKHTIKQNPDMGEPDEFSLYSYRIVENYMGPFYVLLGINRLDVPIKNVSFNLTVGDEKGTLLWDDDTIFLSEEEAGIIPAQSVVPILMPVTKETLQKSKDINFDHITVDMTGFYFEDAGK